MLIKCEAITNYLQNILGIKNLKPSIYRNLKKLPYILQDQFEFVQIDLAGHLLTLAIPKINMPLKQIRSTLANLPKDELLIICLPSLSSYERRYLIEQKVSFLVPGNQLYLLELGIDLREYFRQKRVSSQNVMNPATQAMLLWFLQNIKATNEWSPSEVATALQYTNMTASRAINELVALGLFEEINYGRRKYLRSNNTPQEIWERAKPYFKSPVKQIIWTHKPIHLKSTDYYLAGISALSELSMINPDSETCYAISNQAWQKIKENVVSLPEKEEGATCYQIWSYEPRMYREKNLNLKTLPHVDIPSLWLSLRDNADPRIQSALNQIEKGIRW